MFARVKCDKRDLSFTSDLADVAVTVGSQRACLMRKTCFNSSISVQLLLLNQILRAESRYEREIELV